MTKPRTGVLFVCLGNICRSPLAEAIFVHKAREQGVLDHFDVDSAGMGDWHAGERADPRTIRVGRERGVDVFSIARQLRPKEDLARFHWLIAMDRTHVHGMARLGADRDRMHLMMAFDPTLAEVDSARAEDVPDPYQGDYADFERVFDMLEPACEGLLAWLMRHPRT